MKIIVVKPHYDEPDLSLFNSVYKIFLAGTIDAGNSEDWQSKFIEQLKELESEDNDTVIVVYNPRRDSGEGFNNDNKKEMEYQINWELHHLDIVDRIYMNLLPNSKSPISLLELGLYADSNKLQVICPKEFYRYDNVRIVCKKYAIPYKHSYNEEWQYNWDIL